MSTPTLDEMRAAMRRAVRAAEALASYASEIAAGTRPLDDLRARIDVIAAVTNSARLGLPPASRDEQMLDAHTRGAA